MNGKEKSILDFFLVCRRMKPFITKMVIDESGDNKIVRFKTKKIIESDHNSLILNCSLKYKPLKQDREEMFNFKNENCQKIFKEKTNKSSRLTDIFHTNKPFLSQFNKFKKNINSYFHQSFQKIWVTKTKPRKETKGTWLQRKQKHL